MFIKRKFSRIVRKRHRSLFKILAFLVLVVITRQLRSALSLQNCPTLSFSEIPLPSTALASFPGTGNTWVRHLIQKMTGIATGNIFSDGSIQRGGFPGEGIKDGSVVVIKTHLCFNDITHDSTTFQRAILIVRNPYEALLAEFRRYATKNHTGYPKIDRFKLWDTRFYKDLESYRNFYLSWLNHKELFPLFYDDLRADLPNTLSRILSFLREVAVDGNIQCALEDSEGNFHRNQSKLGHVEFFYSQNKINVTNKLILELNDKFRRRFRHVVFDMRQWLMK